MAVRGGGEKRRIGYILAPSGQAGGGMGRVKDYILQSGGDRHGRIRFVALDTRGPGSAVWSIPLTARAVLQIWMNALIGRVAFVHVNLGDRGSAVRKGLAVLLVRLGAFIDVRRIEGEGVGAPHEAQIFRDEEANGLLEPAGAQQDA